jgi:hypothetical protein
MRERVDLKSPVRENRPPGSVRGAPGNRRPYRDVRFVKPCEFGVKVPRVWAEQSAQNSKCKTENGKV